MFETVTRALKTPDIRNKILFTLTAVLVFRLLAAIPTPGIPAGALKEFFAGSSFGDVLSMVSGGVLENASIVSIGLGPYINASIIIQLLTTVIPKLERLSKEEGEHGRRILNQYTRILTVPLAILQSFVIYSILKEAKIIPSLEPFQLLALVATLTGGAVLLMWIGELISEMGIGNGSSVIICAGILAGMPGVVRINWYVLDAPGKVGLVMAFLVMMLVVVIVNEAYRRVEVQYARRVRGSKAYGGQSTHLPLKINQAGVMPVIFALSILSFPQLILKFFTDPNTQEKLREIALWVLARLDDQRIYNLILFFTIILFAYFYTFISFNPKDVAENLKKHGGFIPGIRPGKKTAEFLTRVMVRLAFVGALFLAAIAVLPSVARNFWEITNLGISGTGLLIVVGVVLDVKRQLESMLVTRHYGDFV